MEGHHHRRPPSSLVASAPASSTASALTQDSGEEAGAMTASGSVRVASRLQEGNGGPSCPERQLQQLLSSLPRELQQALISVCGGDCAERLAGQLAAAYAGEGDKMERKRKRRKKKKKIKERKEKREGGGGEPQEDGEAPEKETRRKDADIDSTARSRRLSTNSSTSSSSSSRTDLRHQALADLRAQSLDDDHRDIPASVTAGLPHALQLEAVERVHMLYNPYSGKRKGGKVMKRGKRLLEEVGIAVSTTELERPGHAEELCRTMDLDGVDVLCSVGGDGTFHECVNGLMKRKKEDGHHVPPLAFIPAGTGNSFAHELGFSKVSQAVQHILRGIVIPIDVSQLTFGDSSTCYSFNSIHWGIASKVNVRAERLRWMGNAVRYLLAAFIEMTKGKIGLARVIVKDREGNVITYNEKFALAIANNIITASRGMKLAPHAKIDDGLIDLLLFDTASVRELLVIFRKLYDGSHVDLPHIRYVQAQSFTIIPYKIAEVAVPDIPQATAEALPKLGDEGGEPENTCTGQKLEAVWDGLDVDGELKGQAPFTCVVEPRALNIIL